MIPRVHMFISRCIQVRLMCMARVFKVEGGRLEVIFVGRPCGEAPGSHPPGQLLSRLPRSRVGPSRLTSPGAPQGSCATPPPPSRLHIYYILDLDLAPGLLEIVVWLHPDPSLHAKSHSSSVTPGCAEVRRTWWSSSSCFHHWCENGKSRAEVSGSLKRPSWDGPRARNTGAPYMQQKPPARSDRITWADDIRLVASSAHAVDDILRNKTALLKNYDLPCDLGKTQLWAAPGLGGEQGWPDSGVFGVHYLGAGGAPRSHRTRKGDPEAWQALWTQEVAAQSLPLRTRWAGWKQRAAPVFAFGARQWTWDDDSVKELTSDTSRLVRLLLHLHKGEGQTWVDWHIASMCRTPGWVLSTECAMWPHRILAQCASTLRIRWSDLDLCTTFIGRALRRRSERYNQDAANLYRAVCVPRYIATTTYIGQVPR